MECHRDDEEAMKAAIEVIGNFACAGEDDDDDGEDDGGVGDDLDDNGEGCGGSFLCWDCSEVLSL